MSNYSSALNTVMVPPRLLGGATLLFWGVMTGELVVSLIVATLLEAKNWVKLNWDFDDAAYVKAFQVSLGLLAFVLFLIWMGEVDYHSLNKVMKWFPICLLPIELAQRYGRRDYMNMNTFFYFARQRMKQDIKEGKPIDPNVFNTGYPYIFIVILVASCSDRMDVFTVSAMLVLLAAIIVSVAFRKGLSVKRMIWAVPIMLITVSLLQHEALGYYKGLKGKLGNKEAQISETSIKRTTLGNLGEVKQTQDIQWRMWGDSNPEYLRLNIYDQSNLDGWSYDFLSEGPDIDTLEDAFDTRTGIQVNINDESAFIFENEHITLIQQERENRTSVRIRGAGVGPPDSEESVVLSMPGFYGISDLHGDEVRAAVHPLGVLKLVERKAVIDYHLWYDSENRLDKKPTEKDLQIPGQPEEDLLDKGKISKIFDFNKIDKSSDNKKVSMFETVSQLSDEMGLSKHVSAEAKVEAIRRFFNREFAYSLAKQNLKKDIRGDQILYFMREGRVGHCEYFATTAALLLREQGIPTRYCVGYAVKEKAGDAWVMRGTHAHAWCTAWINGAWQIVDLTPPDWLSMENDSQKMNWTRGLQDWFHNIKQDFLMWRTVETNKKLMNMVIWGLAIILLLWASYKLYKSRQWDKDVSAKKVDFYDYDISADLLAFEGDLRELLGKRAKSQTYYKWVLAGEGKVDNELFSSLRGLVSLHEESRFGGKDRGKQMMKLSEKIKSLVNEL